MILTLWDHMLRLWQYYNNALHEDDSTRVAQFKVEAVDRDIARSAVRHNDLRSKLHEVQKGHTERREHIQTLQHNSQKCWASLAKLYLDEAENRIETDTHLLDQYLQGRVGVGKPVRIIPHAFMCQVLWLPVCSNHSGFELVLRKRNKNK
jgi:hypothetical protein